MLVADIIKTAVEDGVLLFIKEGKLAFKAQKGALSEELKAKIVANKADIIEYLKNAQATVESTASAKTQVTAHGQMDNIPLSYSQKRLWLIDQLEKVKSNYNIAGAVEIKGELDIAVVKGVFNTILERHQVLRSNIFQDQQGHPYLKVKDNYHLPFFFHNFMEEGKSNSAIDKILATEKVYQFDLREDVLLRINLIQRQSDNYILMFNMHHIASDGWSMGVLVREFVALYQATMAGTDAALPPLPIQFSDYAIWQDGEAERQVLDDQMKYWEETLAHLPLVHNLPLDHARPIEQTFNGGVVSKTLPADVSARLNSYCKQKGITLFILLQAAYNILLARYSNENDIVVGTPVAGRVDSELEQLIGFFVNTLVLRNKVDLSMSFTDFLAQVKRNTLDAFAHQKVPFDKLVEKLQPARSLSHSPLIQVLLVLQNNDMGNLSAPGLEVEQYGTQMQTLRFDLELNVYETDDGMAFDWLFNTDIFKAQTIERMASNLLTLLDTCLAQESCAIGELPLLTEQEYGLVQNYANAQEVTLGSNSLIELFESHVHAQPDAVCLIDNDAQYSYAQVSNMVDRAAWAMHEKGVKPGQLVGLSMERNADLVVALLAILKVGAAYVPLDYRYPSSRLNYIIKDANIDVVIVDKIAAGALETNVSTQLYWEELKVHVAKAHDSDGLPQLAQDNLAYVIYTSGTTGQPKGVLVEHKHVLRLMESAQRDFTFGADDVWTLFHSYAFDFSVWEIWGALGFGGKLVVVDYDTCRSSYDFQQLLCKHKVTVLNQTPSAFYQLSQESNEANLLEDLRYVIFGGEALDINQLRHWFSHYQLDQPKLVNMFGITETTVHVTYSEVAQTQHHGPSVIGKPLSDLKVRVCDEYMAHTPIGVAGELLVGGAGVTRGYLNRPELTEQRFVTLVDEHNRAERYYRSGDLVRWNDQGELEYLGRIDRQVKLRGFRIELSEIESQLAAHNDVSQAVVVLNKGQDDEQNLVGYVVPNSELWEQTRDVNEGRVNEWQNIFNESYSKSQSHHAGTDLNITGWTSSYTNELIPDIEMKEWVEQTVDLIHQQSPKHILEVGCGTGMLLSRYADACQSVHALDLSESALANVSQLLAERDWQHVHLYQGDALQLGQFSAGQFDTVVINSVIQYFPDAGYLKQVIQRILPLVKSGGRILLGDLRNHELLSAFTASVLIGQTEKNDTIAQLQSRINHEIHNEEELLLSPGFFTELQQQHNSISEYHVHLKCGQYDNEMQHYRYDVVIEVEHDKAIETPFSPIEWQAWQNAEHFASFLKTTHSDAIGFSGLPNSRIAQSCQLLKKMDALESYLDIDTLLNALELPQVNSLWQLKDRAKQHEFELYATWSGDDASCVDIILTRNGAAARIKGRQPYKHKRLHNYPQLGSVSDSLLPALKQHLSEQLPSFMIPSQILLLAEVPITENGKVDQIKLPKPLLGSAGEYVAPTTDVEKQVQTIWQKILKLDAISVNDNFFELGGHSLLAARTVNEIRNTLSIECSVRALFESPTIRTLAASLAQNEQEQLRTAIEVVEQRTNLPLSFSQQRLWFIDQLEQSSVQYNISSALKITGNFNLAIAEQAMAMLIERHEVLRTVYVEQAGSPSQVIRTNPEFSLQQYDLSHLAHSEQRQQVNHLLNEHGHRDFVLGNDLMMRAMYIHLGNEPSSGIVQFVLHHIAADGWSLGILQREFVVLYESLQQGREVVLPELAIQYADYAVWQRKWLQGEVLERQVNYWREQLADLPAVHSVPLDNPRPVQLSQNAASHGVALSAQVSRNLRLLKDKHNVTSFMLLHAIFSMLVARHSNHDDVVVGTPVANRLNKELESVVGFFANTQVLRVHCDPAQSFGEFLAQVKETHLDAQEHQDIPFEFLVEELNPVRSQSHSPLFQLVFAMDTTDSSVESPSSLTIEGVGSDRQQTAFDLSVFATDHGEQITFSIEYNANLFNHETIKRFAQHLSVLCEAVSVDCDKALGAYPVISAAEAKYVAEQYNNTAQVVGDGTQHTLCMQELFIAQALKTPDAIAIEDEHGSMSYAQLLAASYTLSQQIAPLCQQTDSLVGVRLDKGRHQAIACLAIQIAGGAYLPLDTEWPTQRCLGILTHAKAVAVVSSSDELAPFFTIAPSSETSMGMSASLREWASQYRAPQKKTDLAYVIFTSGSTGKPKGVAIEHHSAVNTILDINDRYQVTAEDKVLVVSALTFDLSVYDLYGLWAVGGCAVFPAKNRQKEPRHWMELVEQHQISIWDTVPISAQLLVEQYEQADLAQSKTIRVVMMSGDWIPPSLPKRLWQVFGDINVNSLGGATEGSIWSITYPIKENTEHLKSIPYGYPLANQSFYVLNSHQQLCPMGVDGELYIGGVGVAREYLNDPERSADHYIWCEHLNQRLYRTGDLGKLTEQGYIEFVGRVDNQIKLNGYRIELGEVQSLLKQRPSVEDALVIIWDSEDAGQHLLAYVIFNDETLQSDAARQASVQVLKDYLTEHLPSYMLPRFYEVLDAFPLSANGKLDRKALPVPDLTALEAELIAPEGEVEIQLADIWANLLNISTQRIGRYSNLFDLGGHSLLVIRLTSEIRATFNREVSVKSIFEHSTLAAIASLIEHGEHVASTAIEPVERTQNLPLSFAQQRLWLLDSVNGSSVEYNMPAVFKLKGRFDVAAANQALSQVIARHESLRTVFVTNNGEPIQKINDAASFALTITDLSAMPEHQQQLALREAAMKSAGHVFDLSKDLMLTAEYMMCSEREGYLLFNMHHIATDGWSMGIITSEFAKYYQAIQQNVDVQLAPLAIQYADYAAWQRAHLQGAQFDKQVDYWQRQLEELPTVHSLPLDFPRPEVKQQQGAIHTSELSAAQVEQLQQRCREFGVTPFIWMHAVLAAVLVRHSNTQDIAIGTPVANRTQPELESLVGFFVNTLVLRTQQQPNCNFRQWLEHVKEVNLDAQANQDVPFEQLIELCDAPRSRAHSPLFQILFSMDTTEQTRLELPQLELIPAQQQTPMVKFDLEISVEMQDDKATWVWRYDTSLFTAEHISLLSEHTIRLLDCALAQPDNALSTMSMLSPAEFNLLNERVNNTPTAVLDEVTLHALFEQQVAKTPNNIAVWSENTALSYRELNDKANQLAHFLRAQGVGHETLVGLYMTRDADMLVGILAILKAGGGYVPLDPQNPSERLQYMLADTQVEHVIANEVLAGNLDAYEGAVYVIETVSLQSYSQQNPASCSEQTAQSLAYVIYTSGSTGKPKGVMLQHDGAVNLARSQQQRFAVESHSRVLQFAAIGFDAAVSEWVMTLLSGATLHMCPEPARLSMPLLSECLAEHQITHVTLPPALLHDLPLRDDYALKSLILAGEACEQALADKWRQHYKLINAYGPTEVTVCATTAQIDEHGIVLGRALDNLEVYVLSPDNQLAPKGSLGELCVSGVGVARGYLGKAEQTAAQFIVTDIPELAGKRLYKTGDLVCFNVDNQLKYVGRAGEQVSLRGNRVELGEVEQQLTRLPGVASAQVSLIGEHKASQYLLAHVVLEPNTKFDEQQLKSAMAQKVLPIMVPSRIMALPQWPLTINGKINKKELPQPEVEQEQLTVVPARNEIESQLVEIWAKLLNKNNEQISIYANFFELGGNSLLGIRLITEIEATFAVRIEPAELFSMPTLAECAQGISTQLENLQGLMTLAEEAVAEMSDEEAAKLLAELESEV